MSFQTLNSKDAGYTALYTEPMGKRLFSKDINIDTIAMHEVNQHCQSRSQMFVPLQAP
jgi:hypothetical protein